MIRRKYWLVGAFGAVVVGLAALVFPDAGGQPGVPGPPGSGPLTVVTMGDSTLSGEGAGDYSAETDGAGGNWCHRSSHAAVGLIDVPGVDARVNLACSGASTDDVLLDGTAQWTEPSQARQLGELARTNRVAAVVVAIGANDDPRFSRLMSECVNARISLGPPCRDAVRQDWAQRLDAVVPKVVHALDDIRTALGQVGYDEGDYQLVLLSYASPVAPDIPEELRNLSACPFRNEDLAWIRDHAVGTMAEALREAAGRADARFLDFSQAGRGREACAGGNDPGREWFTRLTLDWDSFGDPERAAHASVESFHPNAEGHRQFARCIGEFLGTPDREASCVADEDGDLRVGGGGIGAEVGDRVR
ncbi:GDSL-type esterase/lipase family protein [Saccharothrix syringae]|nr:GDSL-type esterase/lipase family protein [Saccharothrix syringae]